MDAKHTPSDFDCSPCVQQHRSIRGWVRGWTRFHKHELIGYHDSVRAETAHLGINVLIVAPGSVRTGVSRNALGANAQARGVSDAAIDQGMEPTEVALRILDAVLAGERELILAEGLEAEIVRLRRAEPNALFDLMSKLVANGYAKRFGNQQAPAPN